MLILVYYEYIHKSKQFLTYSIFVSFYYKRTLIRPSSVFLSVSTSPRKPVDKSKELLCLKRNLRYFFVFVMIKIFTFYTHYYVYEIELNNFPLNVYHLQQQHNHHQQQQLLYCKIKIKIIFKK